MALLFVFRLKPPPCLTIPAGSTFLLPSWDISTDHSNKPTNAFRSLDGSIYENCYFARTFQIHRSPPLLVHPSIPHYKSLRMAAKPHPTSTTSSSCLATLNHPPKSVTIPSSSKLPTVASSPSMSGNTPSYARLSTILSNNRKRRIRR